MLSYIIKTSHNLLVSGEDTEDDANTVNVKGKYDRFADSMHHSEHSEV